jgi:hypothetical protein
VGLIAGFQSNAKNLNQRDMIKAGKNQRQVKGQENVWEYDTSKGYSPRASTKYKPIATT